jgi:hypothetical protein
MTSEVSLPDPLEWCFGNENGCDDDRYEDVYQLLQPEAEKGK